MPLDFLIDTNLPIDTDDEATSAVLHRFDVRTDGTTDLERIGRAVAAHEPDIAYIPSADYHRSVRRGDRHYRGLVMPTSKFTGAFRYPSVLVVRSDDDARELRDLRGSAYGYINRSCTSSWFPPLLMLNDDGIRAPDFLDMRPVKPWQGQIDAVIDGTVRATMVPEDVWRTDPANADRTTVIDRYDAAIPALIVVRHDLDRAFRVALAEALCAWSPPWSSIYGCFRPVLEADLHAFFHALNQLPADS